MPNTLPTSAEMEKAMTGDQGVMIVIMSAKRRMMKGMAMPRTTPMRPPLHERITVSITNWMTMSRRLAPRAVQRHRARLKEMPVRPTRVSRLLVPRRRTEAIRRRRVRALGRLRTRNLPTDDPLDDGTHVGVPGRQGRLTPGAPVVSFGAEVDDLLEVGPEGRPVDAELPAVRARTVHATRARRQGKHEKRRRKGSGWHHDDSTARCGVRLIGLREESAPRDDRIFSLP